MSKSSHILVYPLFFIMLLLPLIVLAENQLRKKQEKEDGEYGMSQISKRDVNNRINDARDDSRPLLQSILDLFKTSPNTIIRTKESREFGAKYLNESEMNSKQDCIVWCWNYRSGDSSPCNLAVYEEKNRRSCYLFDCGSPDNFKCKFTTHDSYTSSILSVNRQSYDLAQWKDQSRHEDDLLHLRYQESRSRSNADKNSAPSVSASQTIASSSSPPSFSLSAKTSNTKNSLELQDQTGRCQHYQFACKNSTECIAIYNVCDGIAQCPDGSDESQDLHCPQATYGWTTETDKKSKPTSTPSLKIKGKQDSLKPTEVASQGVNPLMSFNYPKAPEALIEINENSDDDAQQAMALSPFSRKYNTFIPKFSPQKQSQQQINNKLYSSYNQYPFPSPDFFNPDALKNNPYGPSETDYIREPPATFYWPLTDQQKYQSLGPYPDLNLAKERELRDWSSFSRNVPLDAYTTQDKMTGARPPKISSPLYLTTSPPPEPKATKASVVLPKVVPRMRSASVISHDTPLAVSHLKDSDSRGRDTNSAVIALTLGLCITGMLVALVGCRMNSIRRRIARRGGRSLAHDADYLVNGMYL